MRQDGGTQIPRPIHNKGIFVHKIPWKVSPVLLPTPTPRTSHWIFCDRLRNSQLSNTPSCDYHLSSAMSQSAISSLSPTISQISIALVLVFSYTRWMTSLPLLFLVCWYGCFTSLSLIQETSVSSISYRNLDWYPTRLLSTIGNSISYPALVASLMLK